MPEPATAFADPLLLVSRLTPNSIRASIGRLEQREGWRTKLPHGSQTPAVPERDPFAVSYGRDLLTVSRPRSHPHPDEAVVSSPS